VSFRQLVDVIKFAAAFDPEQHDSLEKIHISLSEILTLVEANDHDDANSWTLVDKTGECQDTTEFATAEFERFAMFAVCKSPLSVNVPEDERVKIFAMYENDAKEKSRKGDHASFFYAACLHWGFGVNRDVRKAYRMLLRQETPEAFCLIGEYFEYGPEIPGNPVGKDFVEAFKFFELAEQSETLAAESPTPKTKYLLAHSYINGEGTEKNEEKGSELLKDAAASYGDLRSLWTV